MWSKRNIFLFEVSSQSVATLSEVRTHRSFLFSSPLENIYRLHRCTLTLAALIVIMFSLRLCLSFLAYSLFMHMDVQSIPIDWQSSMNISSPGFLFSPTNFNALFLLSNTVPSLLYCARLCHSNYQCRIFDYDPQSRQCRLFQGDIATMGSLTMSPSLQSRVGSMKIDASQFLSFGQACSSCVGSRYLRCVNSTCQCPMNTFFDGSICQSQKLIGGQCVNSNECRSDLNHTCLTRMQCGREYSLLWFVGSKSRDVQWCLDLFCIFLAVSIQSGVLVGGYGNGSAGSALNALRFPGGVALDPAGSIYVSDFLNHRVIRLEEGSLMGSMMAGTGFFGSTLYQLKSPSALHIDASSNVYVSDSYNSRVMFWRRNSSSGVLVAGSGTAGITLATFNHTGGIVMDSLGNLYISDYYNHRVMKWAPNATIGILIAGIGLPGSGSHQLDCPFGLYLDETNSLLYIADTFNHRIQRYNLNGNLYGTTVAGGNGPGPGSHQLNTPYDVHVSKRTGSIYIADFINHRVQRYAPGAINGSTVVGVTSVSGTSPVLLNGPASVFLNANESFLYVSEMGNSRIQKFLLI